MPLSFTVLAISSASSFVKASTFSVKMCFPAFAAAMSTWGCSLVAVVTDTPSMEGSERTASRSGWKGTPSFSAICAPRSGSLSQRQQRVESGFFWRAVEYSMVCTCHAPRTAMFIIVSSWKKFMVMPVKSRRALRFTQHGPDKVCGFKILCAHAVPHPQKGHHGHIPKAIGKVPEKRRAGGGAELTLDFAAVYGHAGENMCRGGGGGDCILSGNSGRCPRGQGRLLHAPGPACPLRDRRR